ARALDFEVEAHRLAFGGIRLPSLGPDDFESRRVVGGDEFVEGEGGGGEVHGFAEEFVTSGFTVAFVRGEQETTFGAKDPPELSERRAGLCPWQVDDRRKGKNAADRPGRDRERTQIGGHRGPRCRT